ncbi:monodechloroaminopyrrolnitrin synthase PrnB family protein [Streptomyces sp. NPDC005438]|uniref:monodechloroaminopyrrolnitrin synthase PrnB family protein n=1 Tax=Streptomyces sp. NPDC005438 TaxID=3156880 RepID=UPI0033B9026C
MDYGHPARIHRVRALDPLDADDACARLPDLNHHGDHRAILGELARLLPAAEAPRDPEHCLAALRDLGLFLGSLKRWGLQPTTELPRLDPLLRSLGRRTDMVPRDTVHHYTTWNPVGTRQRMYTGDPQEAHLQESVRGVFPDLHQGLDLLDALTDTAVEDPRFADTAHALADRLDGLTHSIARVSREVSPEFFARTMRPYFESITVDGRTLLGPTATQVPLWLFDQALWASDRALPEYRAFLRDSVPYALPSWRRLFHRWAHHPSLVSRLAAALGPEDARPAPPEAARSARALARVLRVMVVFRGRHLTVARRAYHLDLRLYSHGSGGAEVGLLREVLDLTRQMGEVVRRPDATRGSGAARGSAR